MDSWTVSLPKATILTDDIYGYVSERWDQFEALKEFSSKVLKPSICDAEQKTVIIAIEGNIRYSEKWGSRMTAAKFRALTFGFKTSDCSP